MTTNQLGSSSFRLGRSETEYQLTWGTRGYWCELCASQNKGEPVEIGSFSAGSYWIKEGEDTRAAAVQHLVDHAASN